MVVGRVKELYGDDYEGAWIGNFDDTWWSEYTMYRLTLNFYGVFERLHRPLQGVKLSCFNVWWEKDLPWHGELLFGSADRGQTSGNAAAEECEQDKCLFTVLQSTSGITVANIAKQLNELGVF